MNKLLFVIVAVLIIGVGAFYLFDDPEITGKVIDESSKSTDTKTFVIGSENLRFYIEGVENPDMIVKEGDKVRIEFSSQQGFHDWRVDEFNAFTEKVESGSVEAIEFIVDKKGTYEYYCSVGKHRANGMKGKFIVE